MDKTSEKATAARFWNERALQSKNRPVPVKWWEHPKIVTHINKRVCGSAIEGFNAGFLRWIKSQIPDLPLGKGVSIGCGSGDKELVLLANGFVEHFDLYEIADERIQQGKELYKSKGMEHSVQFRNEDPFETAKSEQYDLVYWDNALHHMLDVEDAIQWSWGALKKGGHFIMNDYVGPCRFQWTEKSLETTNFIRAILPDRYLVSPYEQDAVLKRTISRHTIEGMIKSDPTEAADSERILPCLRDRFPNVQIKNIGGALYNLALTDIIYNLNSPDTEWLLDILLHIDDLLSDLGENHYVLAMAQK